MQSIQERLVRFVEHSNLPLLLLGKAGTGKTTLIRQLKSELRCTCMVGAPTGVAAMQTEGMTLHALFGLPLAMFLPETKKSIHSPAALDQYNYLRKVRLSREKIRLLQSLDLLIIDEISMVRADTIDAIDAVLRKTRSNPEEPFGGVQLLMVGDLFQLPPVLVASEQLLFRHYYRSTYFFAARVFRDSMPVCLELSEVFRQQDPVFIELLHRIRLNQCTDADWQLLNSRCVDAVQPETDTPIVLTSHVRQAADINDQNLAALPGSSVCFDARTSGRIPDGYFPADAKLILKKDARIIFIKNDAQKPRRYFNGKQGLIEAWNEDEIHIRTEENEPTIVLRRDTWKQIEYVYQEQQHRMEEKEVGRFEQFPIRLAWAITIHKAQGLTFRNLLIDVQAVFTSGLIYVALSRARSLAGIRLSKCLPRIARPFDQALLHFVSTIGQQDPEQCFRVGKNELAWKQFQLLLDGRRLQKPFSRFAQGFRKRAGLLDPVLNDQMRFIELELNDWQKKAMQYVHSFDRAEFSEQITREPQAKRFSKASAWFAEKLKSIYTSTLAIAETTFTDCFTRQEEQWLHEFIRQLELQTSRLLQINTAAQLVRKWPGEKPSRATYSPFQVVQPSGFLPDLTERLRKLQQWRTTAAKEAGCSIWEIASDQGLQALARLPFHEKAELDHLLISVGASWSEALKQSFFSFLHQLKEPVGSRKRVHSRDQTLELIRQGHSIEAIAQKRKLAVQTIEGHVSDLIATSRLPVSRFVDPVSLQQISDHCKNNAGGRIRDIKKELPQWSYGTIRLVLAHHKRKL